jgi:hypothetical protein
MDRVSFTVRPTDLPPKEPFIPNEAEWTGTIGMGAVKKIVSC